MNKFEGTSKKGKVLITGGAGFIGSHVVDELLEHHYEVIIIDNLRTGSLANLKDQIKLYQFDINDPNVELVFELENPDYVVHLAAQTSVIASLDNPYLDFYTNTVGTVNMSLLSKKYNVKKFIFASTAAVYGEPSYLPLDEQHSVNPQSYYSLSKHSSENYVLLNGLLQGLDYCILRLSNVYGPRQNPHGEAGVVSIFINQLMAGEEITIYDGSQTRDFVYVKDVARAFCKTLSTAQNGLFNISSCTETKITDLFNLISKDLGLNSAPNFESERVGEIKQSILDNTKAQQVLEWSVRYPLNKGIKETIEHYSQLSRTV